MTTKEYKGVTGDSVEVKAQVGDVNITAMIDLPGHINEDDKRIIEAIIKLAASDIDRWTTLYKR